MKKQTLFGEQVKTPLPPTKKQYKILSVLKKDGRIVPYHVKNKYATRKYRVEDMDGVVVISAIQRRVLDSLIEKDLVIRNEETILATKNVWYTIKPK